MGAGEADGGEEEGKMRIGRRGSRSINVIVKYSPCCSITGRETGPKTRLNAHIALYPFKITLIAGVAVHKVFHGRGLTASDAKKSIFQCNLAQRELREDGEIIQDSSRSFKVAAAAPFKKMTGRKNLTSQKLRTLKIKSPVVFCRPF